MTAYAFLWAGLWVAIAGAGADEGISPPAPQFEPYQGKVTGDDVYVRSGPSQNYYVVARLSAGNRVTVVGQDHGWLAIVPPTGCYSLIDESYVDKAGDVGVVNGDNVRVRAGSDLAPQRYAVQAQLSRGAEVRIVGQADGGYLKIAPPADAKVWIAADYVERVSDSQPSAFSAPLVGSGAIAPAVVTSLPDRDVGLAQGGDEPADTAAETGDSTELVAVPSAGGMGEAKTEGAPAETPKRDPYALIPEGPHRAELVALEEALRAEMDKPLAERELAALLDGYNKLAGQKEDAVARLYAEKRISHVQRMQESVDAVKRVRLLSEDFADTRREYQGKLAEIEPVYPAIRDGFDAIGELRVSAVYDSPTGPRRYRLVDPAVGGDRTVCYVEIPPDSAIDVGRFLDRKVGVRARAHLRQTGGVDPIPVYVAAELVVLDSEVGS